MAMTAIVGVMLFVFGPGLPFAFVGVLLWGAGTSVGFPMGMSAGADQSELAAGRVSVIATIGYCSFLGGPPLVGFLGNQFTAVSYTHLSYPGRADGSDLSTPVGGTAAR